VLRIHVSLIGGFIEPAIRLSTVRTKSQDRIEP
jgi:hypothetical protein